MPTNTGYIDDAIARLACDVPCFTAKHIDDWFGEVAGNERQRSAHRLKGSLPALKRLVGEGMLSAASDSAITMDFHPNPIRWRPGEPAPDPFTTSCHLRARKVRLARRSWQLSSDTDFGGHEGFFPAIEVLPRDARWEDATEQPKTVTIYSATEKAKSLHGSTIVSQQEYDQLQSHFKAYRPHCDCNRFIRAALDGEVQLTGHTRGLALASFYLDIIGKGRKMAPDTQYGRRFPVDYERNWQGFGSLELQDVAPDAVIFLPQYDKEPWAIALSIWCEHAVDAFHRACAHFQLPYLLY